MRTVGLWILVLLLSGCANLSLGAATSGNSPSGCARLRCRPASRQVDRVLGTGSTTVSLLVEPDDGVTPVIKAINAAQNTILVSAYILSQHRIIRALDRAAAQGVSVYVLLDRYPYGIFQQPSTMFSLLQAAGIYVRWAPSYFQYSHAKFMVLDDQTLVLSSANFTQAGFLSDRDFVLLDADPLDVREADNIFRADWNRVSPVLNDHDLLVSPTNARTKFAALFGRARHTIDVYSEEMLDAPTVRLLSAAARRGIRVRVLATTVASWARRRFQRVGVLSPKHAIGVKSLYIHAKAVIVDDRLAFVGSENFSATSLDDNRELGVITRLPAAVHRLESTFSRDWKAAASSSLH